MKRIVYIIACVLAVPLMLVAKENTRQIAAKHLFVEAPDDVFPLFDGSTRLDMIDYYESGYNRPSLNLFEDSCVITGCDSLCVEVKASNVLDYQLTMPVNNVILLISTYAIPMLDSEIAFYDFKWNKLPEYTLLSKPQLADWLTVEGAKNREDVENLVPFIAAKSDFDVETGTLTITNSMKDYYDKETWQKVSQWLLPQLIYKWTGKKFKKQ